MRKTQSTLEEARGGKEKAGVQDDSNENLAHECRKLPRRLGRRETGKRGLPGALQPADLAAAWRMERRALSSSRSISKT